LATQALISTYSKSPHFDPKKPDEHLPDVSESLRDEIGLIRSIAVKVGVVDIFLMLFLKYKSRNVLLEFHLGLIKCCWMRGETPEKKTHGTKRSGRIYNPLNKNCQRVDSAKRGD
jgi:hypothetical protein